MKSWIDFVANSCRAGGVGLLQIGFPAQCHHCADLLSTRETIFCDRCRERIFRDPLPACSRCAATIGPFVPTAEGCVHCRKEKFAFDGAIRLGPYADPLRSVILQLKHHTGEGLAEYFGEEWAVRDTSRWASMGKPTVVPVPLHWVRRWQRGYNQSAALASGLARKLGWPCRTDWLRRVRHTPLQTAASVSNRHDNVRGAFRAGTVPQKCAIVLVDDVMTTGATASEAARVLKHAGAATVLVAVLARAGVVG